MPKPKPKPAGEFLLFTSGMTLVISSVNPLYLIPSIISGIGGLLVYNDKEDKKDRIPPLLFQGLKPPQIKIEPVNFNYERKTK